MVKLSPSVNMRSLAFTQASLFYSHFLKITQEMPRCENIIHNSLFIVPHNECI